ncbi:hypothetical protein VNO80_30438 [Phaseolus coccineus]|uniref:Uncharacterized protein n=1 Tax=Phaseolus coccineus TaxID=3886 RepID=A0AAN9LD83_PHACN
MEETRHRPLQNVVATIATASKTTTTTTPMRNSTSLTKERNQGTYLAENRFHGGEKVKGGSVEQQMENGFVASLMEVCLFGQ